jgi:hypothetical protein
MENQEEQDGLGKILELQVYTSTRYRSGTPPRPVVHICKKMKLHMYIHVYYMKLPCIRNKKLPVPDTRTIYMCMYHTKLQGRAVFF